MVGDRLRNVCVLGYVNSKSTDESSSGSGWRAGSVQSVTGELLFLNPSSVPDKTTRRQDDKEGCVCVCANHLRGLD